MIERYSLFNNLFIFNYVIFFFLIFLTFNLVLTLCQKNPIHSILFLILSFTNFVFFLLYLGIEFIALLFLIIYVGAISILFLFVLMMLNIKYLVLNKKQDFILIGFFFSFLFIATFISVILLSNPYIFFNFYILEYSYSDWLSTFLYKTDIESIGFSLFNFFYFEFCLSGVILLVAMIGSIALVISSNKVAKAQFINKQIYKDIKDENIFILKN